MNFYYITCAIYGKNSLLCISDRLLLSASFQTMDIGYLKMEKFDIGTPLIHVLSRLQLEYQWKNYAFEVSMSIKITHLW